MLDPKEVAKSVLEAVIAGKIVRELVVGQVMKNGEGFSSNSGRVFASFLCGI